MKKFTKILGILFIIIALIFAIFCIVCACRIHPLGTAVGLAGVSILGLLLVSQAEMKDNKKGEE